MWWNSVRHTTRFDAATCWTPVCSTLISRSTARVTLDVLGTGQYLYHLCCWNLYKYLCFMTAILGSIFKRTWIWPIIIHDVSTIPKKGIFKNGVYVMNDEKREFLRTTHAHWGQPSVPVLPSVYPFLQLSIHCMVWEQVRTLAGGAVGGCVGAEKKLIFPSFIAYLYM